MIDTKHMKKADIQKTADAMHFELLKEIERLMQLDPPKLSRDSRKLRRLAKVVEAYEKLRYPLGIEM